MTPRAAAYAAARAELDRARARRHADYLAGRMAPARAAAYERLLAAHAAPHRAAA